MKPSDNLTAQEQTYSDLLHEGVKRLEALHDAKLSGTPFEIAMASDALHATVKAILRHSPDFMI